MERLGIKDGDRPRRLLNRVERMCGRDGYGSTLVTPSAAGSGPGTLPYCLQTRPPWSATKCLVTKLFSTTKKELN